MSLFDFKAEDFTITPSSLTFFVLLF